MSDIEPPQGLDLRKRRRGIYLLPNLFTTAALFAGFFAIVQAMNQKYTLAAISIQHHRNKNGDRSERVLLVHRLYDSEKPREQRRRRE